MSNLNSIKTLDASIKSQEARTKEPRIFVMLSEVEAKNQEAEKITIYEIRFTRL